MHHLGKIILGKGTHTGYYHYCMTPLVFYNFHRTVHSLSPKNAAEQSLKNIFTAGNQHFF